MKATDLVELLRISKSYVSEILHYKKGMSKAVIRKLAVRFKVSHEAFNRVYELRTGNNSIAQNEKIKNRKKKLAQ